MKKIIILIITLFLITSCAAVKTTITDPKGNIYTIHSKKDALVKYEKDGVKIELDNRGKLGIIESIFGVLVMKTDINLSNKDQAN